MKPLEIHHHPEIELEVKIEVRERERERETNGISTEQDLDCNDAMGWLENMGTWNGYKRVVITMEHMKVHKLA
jgi:hypothetical protein